MVGPRWLDASRVGAAVANGCEMRAAADDERLTGHPRAKVKKSKYISQSLNQSNFANTVQYCTVISAKDCMQCANTICPY